MGLTVYGEHNEDTYLKLEQYGKGVQLIAVDSNGNRLPRGDILTIDANGCLVRCDNVSDKIGINVTCGKIQERR